MNEHYSTLRACKSKLFGTIWRKAAVIFKHGSCTGTGILSVKHTRVTRKRRRIDGKGTGTARRVARWNRSRKHSVPSNRRSLKFDSIRIERLELEIGDSRDKLVTNRETNLCIRWHLWQWLVPMVDRSGTGDTSRSLCRRCYAYTRRRPRRPCLGCTLPRGRCTYTCRRRRNPRPRNDEPACWSHDCWRGCCSY